MRNTAAGVQMDIQKGIFTPNMYLTNMSMAYYLAPDKYVAKSMFPILPVSLSTASYYVFNKGDLARDDVRTKPQFGKVDPSHISYSTDTYSVDVKQIILGIDQIARVDLARTNAPGSIDPRKAKTRTIAEKMNIHQDVVFADQFFQSGAWTNEWTGAAAHSSENKTFIKFSDDACEPIKFFDKLMDEMEETGRRRPNRLGLGRAAFTALKNCGDLLERVKYSGSSANPATVNERVLAELLGVEKILVFGSTYNAAEIGEPDDMRYICDPNCALLAYATDSPAIDEPSAGYSFTWDMLGDGNYMPVMQYDGAPGTHSEYIEGLLAFTHKKTADDLAVFLKDCV